jgi:DNA-binding NtrC family response regulator
MHGERQSQLEPRFGIDCVVLTCFKSDFGFYSNLYRNSGIRMRRAETIDQADFLLTVTNGTVLLTDVVFLDGSWRDAVEMVMHVHPLVASVVIADKVDKEYVSDALGCGAFAVLWKPLPLLQLHRLIEAADDAARERAVEARLTIPA